MNSKELWKDVPNYEGYYEVSNFGNVKSLERIIPIMNGNFRTKKESILKQQIHTNGYKQVALSIDGKVKGYKVHQLVCMAFLNHIPNKFGKEVCDHINENKKDNRLVNLRVVTSRYNASRKNKGSSSKYIGVHFDNQKQKYRATITINNSNNHLGFFESEKEAKNAYDKKVSELKDCYIISK